MTKACIGVVGLVALFLSSWPSQAQAWDQLDIQAELRRPGVRLVVVEFYADFCAPCKKAVPMWNALHKEYKDRGLRLIVISVGDAGTCSNPGWQPDKVICDFDGGFQEAFGAGTLPQAFLYSWQGNLLVKHAHFKSVEKAVREYFRTSPRILVSVPLDQDGQPLKNAAALREIVRTDIQKMATFEMVPTDKELESLRALRKKGYELNRSDEGQCELGKDVSANSELKVKLVSWGAEQTLVLQVYSVENGCMLASSKARVGSSGLGGASFEAVDALLEQMVGKARKTGDTPGLGDVSGGETAVAYTPPPDEDVEWVSSKPAGVSFARSETTLAQYRACVEAGKCEPKHHNTKSDHKNCNWGYPDRDEYPMNCVDWYGAEQFCEWAGGRLPTEQEWEAEASSGGSREFPWGSDKPICSRCVMDDGGDGCGKDRTWPVCSKRRGDSVSGLCDMAGNVWEWTSSWYDSKKKFRVLRGGSWSNVLIRRFRASFRFKNSPAFRYYYYGFRCVVSSQ